MILACQSVILAIPMQGCISLYSCGYILSVLCTPRAPEASGSEEMLRKPHWKWEV